MKPNRKPKYLSPSALACWERDPDAYYLRYICPVRKPRDPQTDPMAVGSAFDALVKNRINVELHGYEATKATEYALCQLVADQCEGHTLPDALEIACILFEQYIECGAYRNLMDVVHLSTRDVRMEFTVTETIGGVPLLGKPDLHFNTPKNCEVICDWKVSGSVSTAGVSPQQGYARALDVHGSRTHGKAHKKFDPVDHVSGLVVNGWKMNESTDYWADQLATYAWALGHWVGCEDWVARIEQIAVRPGYRAKCVVHQSTVDCDYQHRLLDRYQECWNAVESNHIWKSLSKEESVARGDMLYTRLMMPDDLSSLSAGGDFEVNWNGL